MMRTGFSLQRKILIYKQLQKNIRAGRKMADAPEKMDGFGETVHFLILRCFSLSFLSGIKYNICIIMRLLRERQAAVF